MNWKEVTFETVSYYKNSSHSYPLMNMHILDALKLTQCTWVKERTKEAREAYAVGKNDNYELYKMRKSHMPCVTFSGGFVTTRPRRISNGAPTHTIVLDIDHISSTKYTVDEVKKILFAYPSVYWVQLSCSGDGVFALVRIQDREKRQEYFNWFEKDLKDRYGIILDKLSDITRLRYICYDPDPLAKDEIVECIDTLSVSKHNDYETREMSVYKRIYQEMREKEYKEVWTLKTDEVEHLSHPDRMLLFNSLRCIYKDERQKVMEAWKMCMRRMKYSAEHSTKLDAALDEPIRNKWFDYQDPHISYKILFKFYDKKEIKRDETEQN